MGKKHKTCFPDPEGFKITTPLTRKNEFVMRKEVTRIHFRHGISVAKVMEAEIPKMKPGEGYLFSAQTGSGKTHGILHTLLPFAKEKGWKILYVSNRVAISTQFKRNLVKAIGKESLLETLTPKGLQEMEDFDDIMVITYHRLNAMMNSNVSFGKKFKVIVFDEVHSLIDDALFAQVTGSIWEQLSDCFCHSLRIILDATPGAVKALQEECGIKLFSTEFHFGRDYSYVDLKFFQNRDYLVDAINNDHSSNKWLILVPTITEGKKLQAKLKHECQILSSQTRENDPDLWNKILSEERFSEKICIATTVVDSGVNFKDDALRNIVAFTINPTSLIQVLGRKRRENGDRVCFYCHCPPLNEIDQLLHRNELYLKAEAAYYTDYVQFFEAYILGDNEIDVRKWFRAETLDATKLCIKYSNYVERYGQSMLLQLAEGHRDLVINPMVYTKLTVDALLLNFLKQQAARNNGDPRFDMTIAKILHIRIPNREELWLDDSFKGTDRTALEDLLINHLDIPMSEDEFSTFSENFKALGLSVFGRETCDRKDRDKLPWGITKVKNKLKTWALPYTIEQADKSYVLRAIVEG